MTGLNAREEWGIHSFTSGIYHRVFQERYYNPLRLLSAFFVGPVLTCGSLPWLHKRAGVSNV